MSGLGGGWNIILGGFSKEAVSDVFTDSLTGSDTGDPDESGTGTSSVSTTEKGEYTLYFGGELDGTVGLAEGVILSGTNPEMDSTASVESLIDAKAGETDRYAAQNRDMAAIMDRLGNATYIGGTTSDRATETNIESGLFEGQVGYGYADTVRGELMETKEVFVFENQADVAMAEVEAYTDIALYDEFSRLSASQDGRVVLVTREGDTADIYG
jgi:hypothetical protein